MTEYKMSDSWQRHMDAYCGRPTKPTLPPRTNTQPTGWGTEADKLVNLHGDHDHIGLRW